MASAWRSSARWVVPRANSVRGRASQRSKRRCPPRNSARLCPRSKSRRTGDHKGQSRIGTPHEQSRVGSPGVQIGVGNRYSSPAKKISGCPASTAPSAVAPDLWCPTMYRRSSAGAGGAGPVSEPGNVDVSLHLTGCGALSGPALGPARRSCSIPDHEVDSRSARRHRRLHNSPGPPSCLYADVLPPPAYIVARS